MIAYNSSVHNSTLYIFGVERYIGWGCILNCFMLSSLPCFYAFCWSAIPWPHLPQSDKAVHDTNGWPHRSAVQGITLKNRAVQWSTNVPSLVLMILRPYSGLGRRPNVTLLCMKSLASFSHFLLLVVELDTQVLTCSSAHSQAKQVILVMEWDY